VIPEIEEVLVSVWRQTLVDGAKYVQIGDENIRFEKFRDGGNGRRRQEGDQFLDAGQYVAIVVDGKIKTYG
jgi:hypothetical protein